MSQLAKTSQMKMEPDGCEPEINC